MNGSHETDCKSLCGKPVPITFFLKKHPALHKTLTVHGDGKRQLIV